MKPLTIGQVARQAGIGIETVRFYEREGLVKEPPRGRTGYRQYGEDVVARIRFVQRAKQLGFSLKEIKELLNLRVDPATTCADVKAIAEAKIAEVEEKIQALERIKTALKKVAGACRGRGPISQCPILEAMAPED